MMSAASSAASRVTTSGGEMRMVFALRPPLPTSRPRERQASRKRTAAAGSGTRPSPVSSRASIRPFPRTSADVVVFGHLFEAVLEVGADLVGVGLEIVVQDVVYVSECACRGDRVPPEGGEVEVRGDGFDYLGPADDGADGETVSEALGHHDHVRLHVEGVDAPEVLAGAPEARLDFVGDQEYPRLVQNTLYPLEVAWRRLDETTDALDGLGDKRGDVAGGLLLHYGPHVVRAQEVAATLVAAERAAQAVRVAGVGHVEGRARGRAPGTLARYAHGHEGRAVVGGTEGDDLTGLAVARGEKKRGLVSLRATADEERLFLARDRGEIYELLGQFDLVLDQVQCRGVQNLVHLALYGLGYLGHRVTADRRDDPAEVVQILVPRGVPQLEPLATRELERLLVVERRPGRQRRLVPSQQLLRVRHTRTSSPSVAVKLRSMNLPEPRSPTTSPSLYTRLPRTYTAAGPP